MRKKLFFIASLLMFSAASAQTVKLLDSSGTVVNGDTVTFTHYIDTAITQSDFKHDEFVTVVNATSTDTMSIDLIREEIDIIPGSADYYCWGTQCLLARVAGTRIVWQAFDPVETFPNDSAGGVAPLQIYLSPRGNDGVALFKYTFTDENDRTGANSASVYVKWVILDTTQYSDPVMLFNIKPRKFAVFGDSISRKTSINGDTVTIESVLNNINASNPLFEETIRFKVFNANGSPMQIDMSREEISTVARSSDYFMWNGTTTSSILAGSSQITRANAPASVDPRLTASGDSIKVYLRPDSVGGTAIFKYSFTDINDPNKTGSFFVKWVVDNVTSLSEIDVANNYGVYPNPASVGTTLSFDKALNFNRQEVQLINLLGEQVLVEMIQKGSTMHEITVDNLPKGIYFVNVMINGSRANAKKLIVK